MPQGNLNSLIGIPDYDEATNLSTYLISHGWNADHAYSPEQLLTDLEDGNYRLVVIDLGILDDSEWSFEEYLEEIGPEISVVVLAQPGCDTNSDLFQMDGIVVVRHPYSTWDFKAAIAEVTRSLPEIEEGEDEDITGCLEEDDYLLCEDLQALSL
ncbi:MAG: hypothetical protein AMXMBFR75_20740 [Candidatus Hinthialibacteria bacterium]